MMIAKNIRGPEFVTITQSIILKSIYSCELSQSNDNTKFVEICQSEDINKTLKM